MAFADKDGLYRRFTRIYHILGALGTLVLAYLFVTDSNVTAPINDDDSIFGGCLFSAMTFILCFASSFGMTIWVTFVAGLVMYRHLPKHTFGFIQSKLFPIYFFKSTISSFIQLVIVIMELRKFDSINREHTFLLCALGLLFLSSLINGLWLGPQSTEIMFKRHKIEKDEGSTVADLMDGNADYRALCKRFGQVHGVSALLNMIALFAHSYVLYWIALQLFKYSSNCMINKVMT